MNKHEQSESDLWRNQVERWQSVLDSGTELSDDDADQLNYCNEMFSSYGAELGRNLSRHEIDVFKRYWKERIQRWDASPGTWKKQPLQVQKHIRKALGVWWGIGARLVADDPGQYQEITARAKDARDHRIEAEKIAECSLPESLDSLAIEELYRGALHLHCEQVNSEHRKDIDTVAAAAANSLVEWTGLREPDWRFEWATTESSRNKLKLGVFYEYARESRKLRGLLATLRLVRSEELPTKVREAINRIGDHEWSFEGLNEYTAEKALGFRYLQLREFTDDLVANRPFAEILKKPENLERALSIPAHGEVGLHFWHRPPVSLAFDGESIDTTTFEDLATTMIDDNSDVEDEGPPLLPLPDGLPSRQRAFSQGDDVKATIEVVALRIDWANPNDILRKSFEEFLRRYRSVPEPKASKGPGTGKDTEWLAELNRLNCMRRHHWLPLRNLEEHDNSFDSSNFARRSREAKETVNRLFPWEERSAHGQTYAQRRVVGK